MFFKKISYSPDFPFLKISFVNGKNPYPKLKKKIISFFLSWNYCTNENLHTLAIFFINYFHITFKIPLKYVYQEQAKIR